MKKSTAIDKWRCRGCGCTNDRACPGGCGWVEKDLCDRCLVYSDNFTILEAVLLWAHLKKTASGSPHGSKRRTIIEGMIKRMEKHIGKAQLDQAIESRPFRPDPSPSPRSRGEGRGEVLSQKKE